MTRTFAVAFVAVLTLSLVAGVGSALADSSNTTALDEDTGLTHDSTIEDYERDGYATADVTVPDMSITISDSSGDVGVSGLRHTDFDRTYVRVEYRETIDRTVRFYVPREYWHPHPVEIESVDGETTATLTPVEGSDYTAVEIHFDGETDAVFPVKAQASIVFSARDYSVEWLENETDLDLPSYSGEQRQWEYVPMGELTAENPTFGIDTEGDDVTIQYDAANTSDPAGKEWRTVPSCSSSAGGDAPVCTYSPSDNPNQINVLAQTSSPPDVRFMYDAGFLTDMRTSVAELFGDIPKQVLEDVRGFIEDLRS